MRRLEVEALHVAGYRCGCQQKKLQKKFMLRSKRERKIYKIKEKKKERTIHVRNHVKKLRSSKNDPIDDALFGAIAALHLHHRRETAPSASSQPQLLPQCMGSLHDCTLSMEYIQNGLLFPTPIPSLPTADLAGRLQTSLSHALHHFRPLAGRLAAAPSPDGSGTLVSIACTDQGAEFAIAAAPDVSVADVLSPNVPPFLRSLFPLNGAVNYDGCTLPLLAVQLTELADGLFLACSFNHAAGDGTSYWSFLNAWANISRGRGTGSPSPPPIFERWLADGQKVPIELPFVHLDQFIDRHPQAGSWRERVFHFSPESVATLKSMANRERGGAPISSFQSVASLLWRSVMRARGVPAERETRCHVAINNRTRIRPALAPEYFGGAVDVVEAAAPAGELLERGLGWGARRVHEAVAAHTDGAVRRGLEDWMVAPQMFKSSELKVGVKMGSSARFEVYECDFGWGRPVAVRSGSANKYVGKVTFHPGREGGGSMELEVCLEPDAMEALMRDTEFAGALRR